jgi:cell division protein FtsZ
MEVNEASSIIQEAAHEDANIIFGAVVDPNLTGKVKITVIATGFDRKGGSRHVPAAAMQTPVDLQNYAAYAAHRAAEQPMEQPLAQASGQGHHHIDRHVTGVNVSRRTPIDLTLPSANGGPLTGAAAGAVSGVKSNEEPEPLELRSPLDVPAFLRRQS